MFERYTEAARRALFFARYEVSRRGGTAIETEHLVLGLLREDGVVTRLLGQLQVSPEDIRGDVRRSLAAADRISTSVEIPFSAELKRVLQFAATEADGEGVSYIGTEHLFMGILREQESKAASVLQAHGIRLNEIRNASAEERASSRLPGSSKRKEVEAIVAGIAQMLERLTALVQDDLEASDHVERMRQHLSALKRHFDELP